MSELKIEESQYRDLKRIEPGIDTVSFINTLGIEVDSAALVEHLLTVKGTDQVKRIAIWPSSYLVDLQVVRAFPNLTIVGVHGDRIRSMDGLEWFQHADYLDIRTETNRRRSISGLSKAPIKRMFLHFSREEDIDGVAECKTLQSLELYASKDIDFSKWTHLPLQSLGLIQGKFQELSNISQVQSLESLRVLGCRKLERFTGDNSPVTWMVISGCKKLDLRSVQTFQGIKALMVNGNPNEIALSELGVLHHLENLTLLNCNVEVDILNLRKYFPSLKELDIDDMKKDLVDKLREENPDIVIKGKYTR